MRSSSSSAPPSERAGGSLKTVAKTAMVFGAGVVVSIAILVVVSATLLRQAMHDVVRDVQTIDVIERLERNLLYHMQVSNIYVADPSPATAAWRGVVRTRVDELNETLESLSAGEEENAVLARMSAAITAYFRIRAEAEARNTELRAIVTSSTPTLYEALDCVEELRAVNERQLAASHDRDVLLRRLSALAGTGTVIVVLVGVIGLVYFLRRKLIRPLLGLTSAAAAYRAGDLDARAPEAGPRELRSLARALNEAGVALAEQRRTRLTFVAAVAHDLRTPLQALKTSIELLRLEPDLTERPHVGAVIDRIERQNERLLSMVNDLGDASQIEAGELSLVVEELDLRAPVQAMVELYRPTSAVHSIALDVPDEPVMVQADGMRIEQVVGNLLSNAIKYSPAGGLVAVTVAPRGEQVALSVSDEGPGIGPDVASELFVPFRRGKRTSMQPGSGLGLSVSKRIVNAHGGDIEVVSNPQEGTTFTVVLPRKRSAGPGPGPTTSSR